MTSFARVDRRTVLMAGLAAALPGAVPAQAVYPNRPIRMLVGFSAGGGVDAMARMLAPRLGALLGQQVVIDNRAGAAGLIAGDYTAKAAPDGYTMMLADSSLLIAQYLQPRMTFDPIKSFTPVAAVFMMPLAIIVGNDFPAHTPQEFVNLLKANPAQYSFATSGVGTVQHLGFEMLKHRTETFVVHIPYRGAAQIVPDVIGGAVPIGVVSVSAAIAQAKGGKLRVLALMNPAHLPGAEDIHPMSEVLPGFNAVPRLFLLLPAGTPQAIVDKLSEATRTVMAAPDLALAAAQLGAVPAYMPAATVAADLQSESTAWGEVIR
ncbi:MAG TPA: tripartite tricarboxylate transporter substrate-binding protein, partial [Ramlibacter sp.]|nr:tripartite tricarboxylate transporter substrate-binding protein [Ramlibacter sp.]